MRIHTNTLTRVDVLEAAAAADAVAVALIDHGSRKRDHAFDVKLEGSETTRSRRRPNGGPSGVGTGYAATWDQWGVFLAVLFERDPSTLTTYDADVEHFARRTGGRFTQRALVMGSGLGYIAAGFPSDYHGDHVFRYAGVIAAQSCTKCSAVQRWGV